LKKMWYNTNINEKRRYQPMAHKISDECVACGACADTCPVGAIALGDAGIYEVNADACIDCGACEDGCPVGAIKPED
jgi:NAD-dependent dihydropyrimidine dehydrogenase PreA subunit